ncbi:MAG TPA: SDR family oxidoreductase [Candidatus Dormibacteraeota bacterium]|nr:SDR family oxidoreductase [Candidatus Dormibacteraeota bacterium]
MNVLHGRTALVTGASSGLGLDFATILAERGCNLVLVARREDRLRTLAEQLVAQHGVRVDTVAMSLSPLGAAQELYDRIRGMNLAIDVLINNAGFGIWGPFAQVPWEREEEMLRLDIVALVHLTKLFVRDMLERNRGWILQVSSIGAYQPSPTYATYSAAKAFVLSFGEALSYELRGTNVKVSVLSPGVTETEFLDVAGQARTLYQRLSIMPSRPVAEIGIEAMLRGKPSKVAGVMNAFAAWSLRFMPRRWQAAMASVAMQMGQQPASPHP